MIRRIIRIDEQKCNGCGACAAACHEGAIEMVNGKAKLTREDYCDGLGDCLPACPVDAIRFEMREAPAYDEAAVKRAQAAKASEQSCSCPGSRSVTLQVQGECEARSETAVASQLSHWPVQIKLSPVVADKFDGAEVLVAADCTAYAYGDFHSRLMRGRLTLVGCPKLDGVDYAEKLAAIFAQNDVRKVTVARMSVPCCGGLEHAVRRAIEASGKQLPLEVVTITADGQIRI
ncbi:MAG: 4Fe-4S dicluster domain-containing protein [Ruminococcaceae bacterium]|nr:4Fe-4S dicluster domain-containing protein [Oscillospiraceae bacterium]